MTRSCLFVALLLLPGCCKGVPGLGSSDGGSSSSGSPASKAPESLPPVKFNDPPKGIFAPGEADKLIAKGAPAVVRLVDPGAEPRSPLRYALTPGNATTETSLDVASKASAISMNLPRMTMTYDYVVAAPQGALWPVTATLKSTKVDGGSGPGAMLAGMLRPQFKKLEGLTFTYQIDDRGRVSNMKTALSGRNSPDLADILRTLNSSQQAMSLALPDEPIGKGGKWQVITRAPDSGMDLLQEVICTLTDRKGPMATIDMSIRQFAASDQVTSGGKTSTIKSFTSSATMHTEGEMSAIVPKTGNMQQDFKYDTGQGAVGATNKVTHSRR